METLNNSKNINYSFIAVPTQLFILLDYRLKLVLTSLIQVSTALANSNGWFYYSKEDLKKLCGIKNDKTIIACLETFYRLNLLEVQARTFKNNVGSRTANYYRINFNEIEKYNEYSVYECMNIPELQIAMLDYTSKDYQTTYTAATDNNSSNEESISEPTEPSNNVSEEIPSKEVENVSEGQETSNTEVDEINDDCPLTQDELQEHEEWVKTPIEKRMKEWKEPEDDLAFLDDKEDEEKIAESATESVKVDNSKPAMEEKSYENNTFRLGTDGKRIETASVIPTDLGNVEKRFIHKNIDQDEIGKCYDLCNRFCKMDFPNAITCNDYCNKACDYYYKQYINGKIDESDYKRLLSVTTKKRWEKFPNVC